MLAGRAFAVLAGVLSFAAAAPAADEPATNVRLSATG
jgi:hypothetical protein